MGMDESYSLESLHQKSSRFLLFDGEPSNPKIKEEFLVWESSIYGGGFDNDVLSSLNCDHLLEIATIYRYIGDLDRAEVVERIHQISPRLYDDSDVETQQEYEDLENKFTSLPGSTQKFIAKNGIELHNQETSFPEPPFSDEFKKEVAEFAFEYGQTKAAKHYKLNPIQVGAWSRDLEGIGGVEI